MTTPVLEMHGVLKVQLFQQMLEMKTFAWDTALFTVMCGSL